MVAIFIAGAIYTFRLRFIFIGGINTTVFIVKRLIFVEPRNIAESKAIKVLQYFIPLLEVFAVVFFIKFDNSAVN